VKEMETDPPFLRPISVSQVRKARGMQVTASSDERRAIARHLRLLSVDTLQANVTIGPWRRHGLRVEGELTAQVGQVCTLTAEPMNSTISETFDERFYPQDRDKNRRQSEAVIDVEATDDYESYAGDTVDLGALVVEYLTLAVDPYPKRPGAVLPQETGDDGLAETDRSRPVSPFAKLEGRFTAGEGGGSRDIGAPPDARGKTDRAK